MEVTHNATAARESDPLLPMLGGAVAAYNLDQAHGPLLHEVYYLLGQRWRKSYFALGSCSERAIRDVPSVLHNGHQEVQCRNLPSELVQNVKHAFRNTSRFKRLVTMVLVWFRIACACACGRASELASASTDSLERQCRHQSWRTARKPTFLIDQDVQDPARLGIAR
jgi:hypothetical protein